MGKNSPPAVRQSGGVWSLPPVWNSIPQDFFSSCLFQIHLHLHGFNENTLYIPIRVNAKQIQNMWDFIQACQMKVPIQLDHKCLTSIVFCSSVVPLAAQGSTIEGTEWGSAGVVGLWPPGGFLPAAAAADPTTILRPAVGPKVSPPPPSIFKQQSQEISLAIWSRN